MRIFQLLFTGFGLVGAVFYLLMLGQAWYERRQIRKMLDVGRERMGA